MKITANSGGKNIIFLFVPMKKMVHNVKKEYRN